MARSTGMIVGPVFGRSTLLDVESGRPELKPALSNWEESVSVAFDSLRDAALGTVFAFREHWHLTAAPALYSRAAALPSSALLHSSRFVFDGPSAAAVLGGVALTTTGCGSAAGCLAASFTEHAGALVLVGLGPGAQVQEFMADSDGRLFGLAAGPRVFPYRLASTGVRILPTLPEPHRRRFRDRPLRRFEC